MKFSNYLSLLLLSAACWSCAGKPSDSGDGNISADESADSVTTDQTAKPELLVTPDLTLLEVKGNVKEVKGIEADDYVYGRNAKFDENGNLTHYGSSDPVNEISDVRRDSDGRLTDFLGGDWISVTWSEDKPSSITDQYNELSQTETYKYDDNGLVTEITYRTEDAIEGIDSTSVVAVVYPEDAFDSKGNWIKRVIKHPGYTITQMREILYY